MPDWYRDHSLSPECYPESEYLDWAQDHGLYVDAAGNVDYGPPETGAGDSECCPDCGRSTCTGEDCYWPGEAGIRRDDEEG